MPDENDDLFGEDGDEALDDFNRLTDLLFQRVSEFAEEEDVADDILPLLLLRLSATMRVMAYAVSVAKPSGGGLKLDLDPASAQDLAKSTTTLAKTLLWTSRLLGIQTPELYVLPEVSGELAVQPEQRPMPVTALAS